MRKKTIHLLFLLLFVLSAGAHAENVRFLEVRQSDGTSSYFTLSEKPVITLEDGIFKAVGESLTVEKPLGEVSGFNFLETLPTSVETVRGAESRYVLGHAYVTGMKAGSRVMVYGVDGQKMLEATAGSDGNVDVDLTSLQNGVYIVKSPTSSIKVIKK